MEAGRKSHVERPIDCEQSKWYAFKSVSFISALIKRQAAW